MNQPTAATTTTTAEVFAAEFAATLAAERAELVAGFAAALAAYDAAGAALASARRAAGHAEVMWTLAINGGQSAAAAEARRLELVAAEAKVARAGWLLDEATAALEAHPGRSVAVQASRE